MLKKPIFIPIPGFHDPTSWFGPGLKTLMTNAMMGRVSPQKTTILYIYCKDQFRLRSNTGMDPGPRSPNNEFVECGKKS